MANMSAIGAFMSSLGGDLRFQNTTVNLFTLMNFPMDREILVT